MDVWIRLSLLKELCRELAVLGAGTAARPVNVGAYVNRARWTTGCVDQVEGGTVERYVLNLTETQDIIIYMSSADIKHVIMRRQELATGLTELTVIISIFVTGVIEIASHQGAGCDHVAPLGGHIKSAALALVVTSGMGIVTARLVSLM